MSISSKNLRDDTTNLVRDEISLAKTEISEKIANSSRNVAYLAGGALVAYAALILILLGISLMFRDLFISAGMNTASASLLGFLLVAAVVGLRSGLLPDCQGAQHTEKRISYSNQNR